MPAAEGLGQSPTPTKAFLASSTQVIGREKPPPKSGVRWNAWCVAGGRVPSLFVAEYAWPDVHTDTRSPLDVATLLLGQVRASQRFICLLMGDSSGSSIKPRETMLSTTFFELELFQAIVLDRPTYLLVHDSFKPEALGPYLDILAFGFPDWRSRVQSKIGDSETVAAIVRIARGEAAEEWRVRRSLNAPSEFHNALFRSRDRFARGESSPQTHFLSLNRHEGIALSTGLNLDAISDLMRHRRSFEEEQNNDRRLAFSWLLTRELLTAPLLDRQGNVVQRDPAILRAWNAALKDWHGAASWNGLHSNIYLGTFPTLNTLDVVRQALRKDGSTDAAEQPTEFPGGAYCSSYYSLAKLLRGNDKRFALDLARKTLRMGWDEAAFASVPGNMALLGSIALESGEPQEAVQHFERALHIQRSMKASPRAIGEVLCELAFARLFAGQTSRAIGESREGVDLMRMPDADGQFVIDGFLVRAMFKAAAIHFRAGRVLRGFQLYSEASGHARDKHLDDQYRQWRPWALIERATRLGKRLRR
jgi:hypothetical protein